MRVNQVLTKAGYLELGIRGRVCAGLWASLERGH
jgi:hypothetical protein